MATQERHVLMPARARMATVAAMAPWLARGNRLPDAAPGFIPALSAYFSVEGSLPVAALIRQLVAGDAHGHQWLCADPAWVQAEVNGARLLACGDELGLVTAEANALRTDLVDAFAAHGFSFEMGDASHWQLRLPAFVELPRFVGPDDARGADLFDHLPPGADGRRWRAVLGEVQIVLHNHEVNQRRRERGAVPVNSVWFWGAGALPENMESGLSNIYADDLLLWALGASADVHVDGLGAWPGQAGAFELVDLSGQDEQAIASHWWPKLEEDVLAGRTRRLLVHFAGGERWSLSRGQRLRFWRGRG
ncbi:phosphoglycerate mutase [Pinirhizobacter sp.]|jgi:hypothetical protein|uniref:phosphoglycerate mutase n=1 Tax=Pinirhizobacter sp. TaxID=2950432 RepID=UPI002F3F26D4